MEQGHASPSAPLARMPLPSIALCFAGAARYDAAGSGQPSQPCPLLHHARNCSKRKFWKKFFVHAGQNDPIGLDVQTALGALTKSVKRRILYVERLGKLRAPLCSPTA